MKWLLANNNEWKQEHIDIKKIEQNLKNPTLIDNSEVEHNSEGNNNIEQTETLEVFLTGIYYRFFCWLQNNMEVFVVHKAKRGFTFG